MSSGASKSAGSTKPSGSGGAPASSSAGAAGPKDAGAHDAAGQAAADASRSQPSEADAGLAPQRLSESLVVAAITGQYGPDRSAQQLYGADLGWSVRDRDKLWMLFGDSWTNALLHTIDANLSVDADDAIAYWALDQFPDGASVERYLREHAAPQSNPPWQAEPPPLTFALNPSSAVVTPILVQRDGTTLTSGPALTPLTGFANQAQGDSAGLFAIFFRSHALQCSSGACDSGWTCDTGLGLCAGRGQQPTDHSLPCLLGGASTSICDSCVAVSGGGLCVDTGSSVYDASAVRGRTASVVMTHEVGNMRHDSDHVFATQPWNTERFFTVTARTASTFDPGDLSKADYRPVPVPVNGKTERAAVLLWGRPNLGGVHKQQRDLQLYFAYVPLPDYAEDGHFAWQPRFFAGLDAAGKPRFVDREFDAQPLDLDAARSGEQPEEIIDVCGHETVVYLPSLERFMMLYGGGAQELYTSLVYGDDAQYLDSSTIGPIYVRYAKDPWGPWTAPEPFLEPGDAAVPNGLYAKGGPLYSIHCNEPECVRSEALLSNENSGLYAPNLIEPWIVAQPDSAIDLYWNVSSWNPYQSLLVKSTLRAR